MSRRHGQLVAFVSLSVSLSGGLMVACVDLFHSTSEAKNACEQERPANECDASTVAPADAAEAATPDTSAPADLCAPNSAAAKKLASAVCANLGTCTKGLGENALAPCFRAALQAYDCTSFPHRKLKKGTKRYDYYRCLASAKTCEAVQACIWPATVPPRCTNAGSACPKETNVRSECLANSPATTAESCAAQGRQCSTDLGNGLVGCTGPEGFSCVASACKGTKLSDCVAVPDTSASIDRGYDCADRGSGECGKGGGTSTGPACVPDGPACSGRVTCNGSIAQGCIDSKTDAVDCAALDLRCPQNTPVTAVVPSDPLTFCEPKDPSPCDPDHCEGTTVRSCSNGLRFDYDCATGGRGTCVEEKVAGENRAFCSQAR
jgi:hypothetical protein